MVSVSIPPLASALLSRQCVFACSLRSPGLEQMLCKCQMQEEVMYSRRNEGASPHPPPQPGAQPLRAGASEVGVSRAALSRRGLNQGVQERVRASLGIPTLLNRLGAGDDLTPGELSASEPA